MVAKAFECSQSVIEAMMFCIWTGHVMVIERRPLMLRLDQLMRNRIRIYGLIAALHRNSERNIVYSTHNFKLRKSVLRSVDVRRSLRGFKCFGSVSHICHHSPTLLLIVNWLSIMSGLHQTERPSTPPHYLTYQVKLSTEQISAILDAAVPNSRLLKLDPLPFDKSWNNRIYMIKANPSPSTPLFTSYDYVLKVCGKVWGPSKIQNEIAAHLIVNKYCPQTPTPTIVAWSEDGINASRPGTTENVAIECEGTRPWILMTCSLGRQITTEDLGGPHGTRLLQTIAQHVTDWRTQIPSANAIGNLRLGNNYNSVPYEVISDVPISIEGLLFCVGQPHHPLMNELEYQSFKIKDQLTRMDSEPIFKPREAVMRPLTQELLQLLPELPIFKHSDRITFTHYDVSPRNILVIPGETGLQISAFLDFEFAGFFPTADEFTNTLVHHSDYWPGASGEVLLRGLCDAHYPSTQALEQLSTISSISEAIAPWWLKEGDDLETEQKAAETKFRQGLQSLRDLIANE